MKSEEMKQILLKGNAEIEAGNHEGFLVFCTEDTEWNFLGDRILKGKESVRQYMKENYTHPPKVKVEKLVAEENTLIAIGTISLEGNPEQSYCDVWDFKDGKLHKLKAFVI